jgi:hypothetical protein
MGRWVWLDGLDKYIVALSVTVFRGELRRIVTVYQGRYARAAFHFFTIDPVHVWSRV